jgi:hypothetical protein
MIKQFWWFAIFLKQIGGMLLAECSFVRYNLGLVFEGMAFGN